LQGFEDEITRLSNTKPGKMNLQPKAIEPFSGGYEASGGYETLATKGNLHIPV